VIGDLLHHKQSSLPHSVSLPAAAPPLAASSESKVPSTSSSNVTPTTPTKSKPNPSSDQALPRGMDHHGGAAETKHTSAAADAEEATTSSSSSPSWRSSSLWNVDQLTHMEANIDDATAEVLAYTVEKLLARGAIDAWTAPIVMKKGRAAHTLHCICHSESETSSTATSETDTVEALLKIVFQQTTTLGIRVHHRDVDRVALNRRVLRRVQIPFVNNVTDGCVDVKVGLLGGKNKKEVVSIAAEYDHCKAVADATGVPLKFVSELAIAQARKLLQEEEEEVNV
jgi:hypothetical protein